MAFSEMEIIKTILLVLLASVAAIIYSLRIIVSMDRKLLKIEYHMDSVVSHMIRSSTKVKSSASPKKKVAKKKRK